MKTLKLVGNENSIYIWNILQKDVFPETSYIHMTIIIVYTLPLIHQHFLSAVTL